MKSKNNKKDKLKKSSVKESGFLKRWSRKKSEDKIASKKKLRLKGPIDKKDFKLTVSRALNVEEIEIKQRSLASVKRARLKVLSLYD